MAIPQHLLKDFLMVSSGEKLRHYGPGSRGVEGSGGDFPINAVSRQGIPGKHVGDEL